jgi:hypothetical protein
LADPAVHVCAVACAAGLLVSLFPLLLAGLSLCARFAGATGVVEVVSFTLGNFFVGDLYGALQSRLAEQPTLRPRSIFLLTTSSALIGLAMQVVLDRGPSGAIALLKRLLRTLVIVPSGLLMLGSVVLTPLDRESVQLWTNLYGAEQVQRVLSSLHFIALLLSILASFLIYWLLPRQQMRLTRVCLTAILAGLTLECLKFGALLSRPWLHDKVQKEYGLLYDATSVVFFGYLGALAVLCLAHFLRAPDAPQGRPT